MWNIRKCGKQIRHNKNNFCCCLFLGFSQQCSLCTQELLQTVFEGIYEMKRIETWPATGLRRMGILHPRLKQAS